MLDCSSIIFSRMRLLYASIAIGLLGLVITFFLVLALSEKAIEPEIENSRIQEQFLTNASHELKTPLAVIRSNTEMEELSRGESEWTQSTIRQVDRMSSLIQDLITIAKTRETASSEKAMVNLSPLVAETVLDFTAAAEKEGKTISQSIADNVTIHADAGKIRQLATLLLDNAVKYCDPNGIIIVSLEPLKALKKGARLTVSNSYANGKDLDCSRFFDRFYRADTAHNIDTGGYGIGLSIAESICAQHNGKIRAEWKNAMITFLCELS